MVNMEKRMTNPFTRLDDFKTRCLVWAYVLADPRNGETDIIEGNRRDTEPAVELAALLRGMRVIGVVGIVPREDDDTGGTVALELLAPTDSWMLHVATIAVHRWECKLTERGVVTPAGTVH
jgi:hypothetical protein